jgi:hypothetical protein
MISSPTFDGARLLSLDHVTMAGLAVKQISFRVDVDTAILRSHGLDTHWRPAAVHCGVLAKFDGSTVQPSAGTAVSNHAVGLPVAAPAHWRNYERMFNRPIELAPIGRFGISVQTY